MATIQRHNGEIGPAAPVGRWPSGARAVRLAGWLVCLISIGSGAGIWAFRSIGRSTPDPRALWARAEQDLLSGRHERAGAAIERLGRLGQSSPFAFMLKAQYAAARQEPDAALAAIEQIPEDHQLASGARLLAGQIELRRDRVRLAEEWFRSALRLDSRLIQARRELIFIFGMQLRRAELSAQFLALAQLAPLSSENLFHWCLLRNNSWEPGEAVATLARYVAADPADRWSRLALAENYRRMGQGDSADKVLAPLAADDQAAVSIRVRNAVDRQDLDRAERLLEPTPADDALLASLRGRMALSKRDARSAVHHFRVAFGADPDDHETIFGLVCALELAQKSEAAEPFRQRARNLERLNTLIHRAALPAARNDPVLLRELGKACALLHRDPEARAWFELAIARDPLDSESQRALYHLREHGRTNAHPHPPSPEPVSQSF